MKLVRLKNMRTGLTAGGALLSLALAGCGDTPDPGQPDISAQTLFETKAKPELVSSCQPCHGGPQGSVMPFLTAGMEYASVTGYKGGSFIDVPMSTQSLLLQKGAHTGPALSANQFAAVQAWLDAEIATRPSTTAGMMKSALLPTVPITTGDFNMNLGDLAPINDPQANVTFHLAPDSSNLYRISKLTLTAGPTTGIHIVHPRLYFITASKSLADPADSLATVDQALPPSTSQTIGSGTVLLTNAPTNDPNTRFGLAFETLEKSMAMVVNVNCKDFKDFNPSLVNDLNTCAGQCHAPGKNNTASNAFDMSASTSTNMAMLQSLCVSSLGRINKQMPAMSILLLQVLPTGQGGTPNHPFKYTVPSDITRFTNEVTTWAAGEK